MVILKAVSSTAAEEGSVLSQDCCSSAVSVWQLFIILHFKHIKCHYYGLLLEVAWLLKLYMKDTYQPIL